VPRGGPDGERGSAPDHPGVSHVRWRALVLVESRERETSRRPAASRPLPRSVAGDAQFARQLVVGRSRTLRLRHAQRRFAGRAVSCARPAASRNVLCCFHLPSLLRMRGRDSRHLAGAGSCGGCRSLPWARTRRIGTWHSPKLAGADGSTSAGCPNVPGPAGWGSSHSTDFPRLLDSRSAACGDVPGVARPGSGYFPGFRGWSTPDAFTLRGYLHLHDRRSAHTRTCRGWFIRELPSPPRYMDLDEGRSAAHSRVGELVSWGESRSPMEWRAARGEEDHPPSLQCDRSNARAPRSLSTRCDSS